MPAPTSGADRLYTVGSTVHLDVRVAAPGTKKPLDVTQVRLTSLRRNGVDVGTVPQAFTRVAEGDYALVLPTTGFQEGTYDLVVTLDDGPTAVLVVPDRFVLQAA